MKVAYAVRQHVPSGVVRAASPSHWHVSSDTPALHRVGLLAALAAEAAEAAASGADGAAAAAAELADAVRKLAPQMRYGRGSTSCSTVTTRKPMQRIWHSAFQTSGPPLAPCAPFRYCGDAVPHNSAAESKITTLIISGCVRRIKLSEEDAAKQAALLAALTPAPPAAPKPAAPAAPAAPEKPVAGEDEDGVVEGAQEGEEAEEQGAKEEEEPAQEEPPRPSPAEAAAGLRELLERVVRAQLAEAAEARKAARWGGGRAGAVRWQGEGGWLRALEKGYCGQGSCKGRAAVLGAW